MSSDISCSIENIILVGYSKYFSREKFFLSKINQILDELNDFLIIAVNDDKGFIKKNFECHIVETISSKDITDREVEEIFRKISHSIFFWDGDDLTKFIYQALLSKLPTKIIPIQTTKVANKDRGDEYDVYIGRRGPWGNPFKITPEVSREEVILQYEKYFYETLLKDPDRVRALAGLKGKRLGCHCKPFACHGDIIADYLNSIESFD